jgi:hypothetical protein
LVVGRIDDDLRRDIKEAVRSLDGIRVKDLMELLARVEVLPSPPLAPVSESATAPQKSKHHRVKAG